MGINAGINAFASRRLFDARSINDAALRRCFFNGEAADVGQSDVARRAPPVFVRPARGIAVIDFFRARFSAAPASGADNFPLANEPQLLFV